ncbi:ras guanine nucleotide exchange factor domain-containing protein [Kockovaella imperatae]|uniref:Ras guanine nucleotide exchange factor domain-containing protein n=1 Tax=Kockovaella imperatae TaxID=4999 RepID=A0A1Y1UGW2_9TREE|nr:ras guanine nucleotide exchange factor domain-containing protein [Kockovaella imperatae]ORX36746.1 ras guanine nucleotide exchange factor domain-containing protein [Kockovaella imperatae]
MADSGSTTPARMTTPGSTSGKSPTKSRRTAFTGHVIVPPVPDRSTFMRTHDTVDSRSVLRHSVSDESLQVGRSGRSSSEPPAPPSKEGSDLPSDMLLQAARLKLSSMDQEAMRKLRSTMQEYSDTSDSQSLGDPSILSPRSGNTDSSFGRQGHERSRSSTLSKPVFGMETQSEAGPSVPRIGRPENQVGPKSAHLPTHENIHVDHTIAVLGHRGVGKSTLIKRAVRAWGATEPTVFQTPQGYRVSSCISMVQPGGNLKRSWTVELLELSIEALQLDDPGPSKRELLPSLLPPISGAVLCYDATREQSLANVAAVLEALASQSLPCVLLACKSDPGVDLQVKPVQGDALGRPYNVGLIEVSSMTSEGKSKMRNALRWLLFKLEQRQRRTLRKASPPLKTSPPIVRVTSTGSDTSSGAERVMWSRTVKLGRLGTDSDAQSSSSSLHRLVKDPLISTQVAEVEIGGKPLDERQSAQSLNIENHQTEEVPESIWFSEQTLMNRFFSAIVSAKDDNFLAAFLLTYRRFVTPERLINLLHERLSEVQQYPVATDIRHWALQRLVGGLVDWTRSYPGDFADLAVEQKLRTIIHETSSHLFMAHIFGDLVEFEERLPHLIDLDKSWSSDNRMSKTLDVLSVPLSAASELVLDNNVLYDFESSVGKSNTGTLPTTANDSPAPSFHTRSTHSLQPEDSYPQREQVAHPKPRAEFYRHGVMEDAGFGRWTAAANYLLNSDPATFAAELTRAQWSLFRTIRPRDVFRHDFGNEKETPVNKSVNFFNHMSRWASTMILAHHKAKYRARIYERFMLITHHLRRLNNYDGLYAILSGMQETSIHRLNQTHALIQPSTSSRESQNHLTLMDPRGGYSQYRSVVQSDIVQGKSAIPLLTVLLGMVNRLQSTRREDIRETDNFIQWDKFARFHEILSVITDCQARGMPISGKVSPVFRRIIDETPIIMSEDALFERSRLLEPIGGGGSRAANAFKRFVNNVDQTMRSSPGGPSLAHMR